MADKPTTQREMLEQLWFAWVGTNGEGAAEKLDYLHRHAVTKDECRDIRSAKGVSNKTITLRRVLEVAVVAAVMGCLVVGGLLIFLGKLTAEDIVNILGAWKGGGT